jgi:predicted anti-sigma-YlaC factor YlaD
MSEMKMLLPWYVNGTLNAKERAAVELHLESCGECRAAEAEIRQISKAIDKGQPTPLIPEAPVSAFMEKTFAEEKRETPGSRVPWLAAAASIAGLLAVTYWFVVVVPEPNVFQTVTDPAGSSEISYIFDLETSAADESVRAAVSDAFAGSHIVESEHGYRLTVSMPSATMTELTEFAEMLREIDGVQSVDIVGVQLPLE